MHKKASFKNVMRGSHVFCCTGHSYNTHFMEQANTSSFSSPRPLHIRVVEIASSAMFCKSQCILLGASKNGGKPSKCFELKGQAMHVLCML